MSRLMRVGVEGPLDGRLSRSGAICSRRVVRCGGSGRGVVGTSWQMLVTDQASKLSEYPFLPHKVHLTSEEGLDTGLVCPNPVVVMDSSLNIGSCS